MKITLIAALGLLGLVGCAHTKAETPVCSTEYRPHLCMVTIGSATYAGYGTNKCLARKKLAERLEQAGINAPDGAVECGGVIK